MKTCDSDRVYSEHLVDGEPTIAQPTFTCFGNDHALIKKSHTLNFYSFLQKFLLKTKLTNLLLVTVVAQFTAKTTNSEIAIYFCNLCLLQ